MQYVFFDLVDQACAQLRGDEVLLANFSGEQSDFVRFNQARVRQPMSVRQAQLELSLIKGERRDSTTLPLTGRLDHDSSAVSLALDGMRRDLPSLPPDPYLLYSTETSTSTREQTGTLPQPAEIIDTVTQSARGADLVGLFCGGPIYRGFANSFGARHWHAVDSFLFDWSLYLAADKAVKSAWAGAHWDAEELQQRVDAAHTQLAYLARPALSPATGEYRAYLAPAAMDELLSMLNWGGVSQKAQRTKQSCVQKLVEGQTELSPLVTLREHTADGLAPAFDQAGFTKPASVDLIVQGKHAGSMVSPRTAREYDVAANGAAEDESAESLAMAGGDLDPAAVLGALDRGLYISNLHYLNFSDRANARVTGMTRFATFWVDGGKLIAPVNVMRWDDSLYRMLGAQLEALTRAPEWMLSSSTYGQRSTQTSRVPGALLSKLAFTL